jgi:SAM-dependent methyltransferase
VLGVVFDYDSAPERYRLGMAVARAHSSASRYAEVAARLVALGVRRVLDVGCGDGPLREELPAGPLLVGLDAAAAMVLAHPAPVLRAEAARLPVAGTSFDAVTALDVLSHLADPRPALAEARRVLRPGGTLLASVRSIDPRARRVETDSGTVDADVLVVALGAGLHPEATPGLVECGHEFYTEAGAFALRDVLAEFAGGHIVVGVTSTPFECPPAPSETVLLLDQYFAERGRRAAVRISLVTPLGSPIPPSPAASAALLATFAERGIDFHPNRIVRSLDPGRRVAVLADGDEVPFDLFLGVPVHRAPDVVVRSGLAVDGWIPVDPRTLETAHPGVYPSVDVTSVGTPKAACSPSRRPAWWPTGSSRWCAAASPRASTTAAASAIWSTAATRSRRSTSPSCRGPHRPGRSTLPRRRTTRRRRSSARAGCGAGSARPFR